MIDLEGSKDYYTYTLAYPDKTVFYVGKGKGNRIDDHEMEARNGVQSRKCDIIRSIWDNGEQVVKEKVLENVTSSQAHSYENDLIYRYGCENLANFEGWEKRRKPLLVQVSFSGELRTQIEEAMLRDGIPFSRENFQKYIKDIVKQKIEFEEAMIL